MNESHTQQMMMKGTRWTSNTNSVDTTNQLLFLLKNAKKSLQNHQKVEFQTNKRLKLTPIPPQGNPKNRCNVIKPSSTMKNLLPSPKKQKSFMMKTYHSLEVLCLVMIKIITS